MVFRFPAARYALAGLGLAACVQTAAASSIPRLSFEQIIGISEVIVSARVVRLWSAWDTTHKNIWTHYELAVDTTLKGVPRRSLEIAEPGGSLDGVGMGFSGAVNYTPGERVVVFAQRVPNGYLRTAGWGQGKLSVGTDQAIGGFSAAAFGLEGRTLGELSARVAAGAGKGQVQ